MAQAVRCRSCAGAIAALPGQELPRCLFCGGPARDLEQIPAEEVEAPEAWLPFTVTREEAGAAFRRFAKSSFWHPKDLVESELNLTPLLLPAWSFEGTLEVYWTGLERALLGTRSGKRPVGGDAVLTLTEVRIPASAALTRRELTGLGPWGEEPMQPWDDASADTPHELGEMTRSIATDEALAEMKRRVGASLAQEHGAHSIKTSFVVRALAGRSVLLPVYIGAYRYGDKGYRVLVNGVTGQLLGTAPRHYGKVLWPLLFLVLLALAVALVVGVGTACLGAVGALAG